MPLSEIVLIVMGLLTIAMLAAGLCRNLPIPYTAFLVILGMILGAIARSNPHMEILLEFQLTPELVLFLFLPALLFESAFNMNARQLVKDLAPILTLAIPALLISTAIIGIGLWLLLDLSLGLALLFGALISATDPVAVISLFKELGAPERLTILVEGESLLNDATAIVIFGIILGLVQSGTMDSFAMSDAGLAVIEFLRVFLGGILVGTILGLIVSELLHRILTGISALVIISIVVAYASFALAEHTLHVSGVMAVVAAAITLGALWVSRISQADVHVIKETWEVIATVSNSLLFLLVGLSVDVMELITRADIIAIAIIFVLVARAATIYSLVPSTIKLFSLPHVTLGERHIMWWGGLKGGLAIAIVLSIPENLPGRDMILSLTLGVVIFSLLINAPTIKPLIKILGIDKLTDDELSELKQGLLHAGERSSVILNRFYKTSLISQSTENLINNRTEEVFESDAPSITGEQNLRHLRMITLRAELDELKHLYEIGLIPHYTYLDIKNNLQNDLERILENQPPGISRSREEKLSIFLRLENAMLKRIRELDWAAWFLSRYQNMRLGLRMKRDITGVLICSSVLDMLDSHKEFDTELREQIAESYRERLERRRTRLGQIAEDFPEFYTGFELNFFTQVALTAAKYHVVEEHHEGEIGTKALVHIERMIGHAISVLPPISEAAHKLQPSDLIGSVPLLTGLTTDTLEQLAEQAKAVTFLPGDVIIGEGERGDALYIITHGVVNIYKGDMNVAMLKNGDFFGEMALLGDQVRTATVKSKSASTLLRLRRRDVMQLAERDPDLKSRLEDVRGERQEQTDLVGAIPLLKGLSTEVLQLITDQTRAIRYVPGDKVISEGARGDSLFIIISGSVSVFKEGEEVAELESGDFFGEMALLSDQIRTATVKIKSPAVLLQLRRADIMQLSEGNEELQRRLKEAKDVRQEV